MLQSLPVSSANVESSLLTQVLDECVLVKQSSGNEDNVIKNLGGHMESYELKDGVPVLNILIALPFFFDSFTSQSLWII